jgi:hypothetical protein
MIPHGLGIAQVPNKHNVGTNLSEDVALSETSRSDDALQNAADPTFPHRSDALETASASKSRLVSAADLDSIHRSC